MLGLYPGMRKGEAARPLALIGAPRGIRTLAPWFVALGENITLCFDCSERTFVAHFVVKRSKKHLALVAEGEAPDQLVEDDFHLVVGDVRDWLAVVAPEQAAVGAALVGVGPISTNLRATR